MIKTIAMAGAALSLLVAAPALAGAPAKSAHATKVAQLKRARAAADPRKDENVAALSTLPALTIGVITVGVAVAASAGLVTKSP